MTSAAARIRWRMTRALLRGAVFGLALTVSLLAAASSLPWDRIVGAGAASGAIDRTILTPDGWVVVALALVALAVGGLVQGSVHEWRIRRLVAGPGAVEDPRSSRAATLRGLPIASAAASLASWVVGGTLLAVSSAAVLELTPAQATEIALVCVAVGAMLTPFRYHRVRRELPAFWDLLATPEETDTAGASSPRALMSLPVKVALAFVLPLAGLLLTVVAATAQRSAVASDDAARWRLDATAQSLAPLLDATLRSQGRAADEVRGAAADLINALDRRASRGEVALLGRDGTRIAGRSTTVAPERLVRALERGEPLERLTGVLVGAARVDRVDGWLVLIEPSPNGSPLGVLADPRLTWLVGLGIGGAIALAWMMARDVRTGLARVRAQLDALEPGMTAAARPAPDRFGDDEILDLEAQVVDLGVRVRRARARREKRRTELEEVASRFETRWRDTGQSVAGEADLAVRVRRSAEDLLELVGNVEQLWHQLERELTRQDQLGSAALGQIDGAVGSCDELAGEAAEIGTRVGRLVTAIRPVLDDVESLRASAEATAVPLGVAEDLHRVLTQQCRTAVDACTRVTALARSVELAALSGADGGDRVRVAVGDVGQSVHRIEEGVALLTQGFRVLEEIADRSALLAVNAAIVAARSASAGGGFTIVADEMRDLAQRAADGVHEATHVAGGLARDTRAAVLAVETVLARLDQSALGARGVRSAAEELVATAVASQEDVARAEAITSEAAQEVGRARRCVDQLVILTHRVGVAQAPVRPQLDGGGALEAALRKLTNDLGSSVRASVVETRESIQALRKPAEVVDRLDRLARQMGQRVQALESDLRELANVSVRAQDLARSLVDDVGAAIRERAEPA